MNERSKQNIADIGIELINFHFEQQAGEPMWRFSQAVEDVITRCERIHPDIVKMIHEEI
ncbi:hypothetical protein [Tritonibacter mobilis]|uniref:hypothetical protein n=1 Tax=Tritonibacter mobilis TaxID=379347 RepID=UPI0013A5876D|nr:hypothetical protein [Tritonibacter mobilis]